MPFESIILSEVNPEVRPQWAETRRHWCTLKNLTCLPRNPWLHRRDVQPLRIPHSCRRINTRSLLGNLFLSPAHTFHNNINTIKRLLQRSHHNSFCTMTQAFVWFCPVVKCVYFWSGNQDGSHTDKNMERTPTVERKHNKNGDWIECSKLTDMH